jgi:glycosyltransferase involved in cell wall biosynthesis
MMPAEHSHGVVPIGLTLSQPGDLTKAAAAPVSARSSRSMQIAINCLQVDPSYVGGVTTYVLGLFQGFANVGPVHKFRLYVTRGNAAVFERFRKYGNFEIVTVDDRLLPLRSHVSRAALLSRHSGFVKLTSDIAFSRLREMMESDCSVVYTPTPVLRYFNGRRPSVLTMHDIQHLHHPEFFSWPKLLSRRMTYGLSARHAHYFHANSRFTKADLLNHYRWLSEDQVEVIPPGVALEDFSVSSDAETVCEKYGLSGPFLFCPAQLWPHKNHITILRALKHIESRCGLKIPLVMTGANYSAGSVLFRFINEESMYYVRYLGRVPFKDLIALYRSAAFLVTASLHESSSFPILEAAASGTPIIASRIPPFEEFAEVLQINLFETLDIHGLAALIEDLWGNRTLSAAQADYNREHVAFYSWENTARKYIDLFERAVAYNEFSSPCK